MVFIEHCDRSTTEAYYCVSCPPTWLAVVSAKYRCDKWVKTPLTAVNDPSEHDFRRIPLSLLFSEIAIIASIKVEAINVFVGVVTTNAAS